MQTSPAGKAFIKYNEGTCLTIKPDNTRPQIGHGHDLTPAELASGKVYGIPIRPSITVPQADYILDQDMAIAFDPALKRMLPATANQNQWNSCADFIYNDGAENLATMLHHGWDQVPNEMPHWIYGKVKGVETKLPGLKARRAAEVALFTS
jgi:lysozyme